MGLRGRLLRWQSLTGTWFFRLLFGPAGAELTTRSRPEFAPVDYPLEIIAGNRFIDPVSWLLIPGPNDGKVAVARTRVDGMTDWVILHASHTFLPQNDEAIRQTIFFLRHGAFLADDESDSGR
jgi:triacylglycerol lipase